MGFWTHAQGVILVDNISGRLNDAGLFRKEGLVYDSAVSDVFYRRYRTSPLEDVLQRLFSFDARVTEALTLGYALSPDGEDATDYVGVFPYDLDSETSIGCPWGGCNVSAKKGETPRYPNPALYTTTSRFSNPHLKTANLLSFHVDVKELTPQEKVETWLKQIVTYLPVRQGTVDVRFDTLHHETYFLSRDSVDSASKGNIFLSDSPTTEC